MSYLKENLDIKKVVKNLDKQIFDNDDNILNAVMDSYKNLIDDDGMEISLFEHLMNEEEKGGILNQKIRDLSLNGKLLQTLSKNFKFIRQVFVKLEYDKCYLDCVFSQSNKTYYLILNHLNNLNFSNSVIYKTSSEKKLTKQLGILRNKIIDADNVSVIKPI